MNDMICRYCGARIVWAEGRGWLTVSDSRVVWNTESCVARPTTKGGPEAGHALLEGDSPAPTPDPYVPTTEQVRAGYAIGMVNTPDGYRDSYVRFDRWLESLLATAGADEAERARDDERTKALTDVMEMLNGEESLESCRAMVSVALRLRGADSMEGKAHDQ